MDTEFEIEYDPRIQAQLDKNADHWGDPLLNRENLIPYGINFIDQALYGLDPNGELIVVQGEEKNRKTTMVANVIMNIMESDKPAIKPMINIDSLESGMRPQKYKDTLVSMMATKYLVEIGHRAHSSCPLCGEEKCREMGISPKFLRYRTRSRAQLQAIEWAVDRMYQWNVLLHGAKLDEGNTRSLEKAAKGIQGKLSRWQYLNKEYGMQIMVIDHGQQYSFKDEPTDYEKQIRAISAVGDFVTQYNVTCFFVSQVSLWSSREVRANPGSKLTAAGGAKAAQEANTVFSTSYNPAGHVMKIKVEESRDAGSFSVWQPLEAYSGCFIGKATNEPVI